ncbi:zinc metallopeptidase [Sedimenticola hydrogenitrophicus]|uniref:zinc metallopeptidase n=1 Tax=Sedimenticola hydrogenitrophicus TaxID=2967975 RepID=UPI0021A5EBAB|nr:zinc metallopeptidase [Sedimenticola hydrogenitrophicus]
MQFVILFIVLILLILGPQWWVRSVLARHSREDGRFPGTGGELASHLLGRLSLDQVGVGAAAAGQGDHYDPVTRCVRLTPDNLDGRTLTAVVTAAHEVGHAIQHALGYGPFRWRMRLVKIALVTERLGSFLLFAVPVLTLITKAPAAGALMFLAAVATLGVGLLVQLVTLPVEWDASFGRAMPLLESGYLDKKQLPAARTILRACSLTYLAASLAGLLNFWRWMRFLRH